MSEPYDPERHPHWTEQWADPAFASEMSRRGFIQLLGASLALAGIGGCVERPRERILAYVDTPRHPESGRPTSYATTMILGGYGTGLLVESHTGRPTKIEGNPEHPASLGAAGVYEQASLLQLYDPARARQVQRGRARADWAAFTQWFAPARLRTRAGSRGAGLHLLLEPTASPLIAAWLAQVRTAYPEATVHYYAPLASRTAGGTADALFGAPLVPRYDFRQAEVILALDADFLAAGPFHLRYARDFAERRRPATPGAAMNRLYAVEPVFSVTGASADHRLRARAADIEQVVGAVAAEVVLALGRRPAAMPETIATALERYRRDDARPAWTAAVARDLAGTGPHAAVIAGDAQPERVYLLAHLLNHALGSAGTTLTYHRDPLDATGAGAGSRDLASLVDAMRAGAVHTLVMLETNPTYTAPADLDFGGALQRVTETVSVDLFRHETGQPAQWFVPTAHYLETWGDARAYDGTASLVQPLIAPLYGGKTAAEVLAVLAGEPGRSAHDLVRAQWSEHAGAGDFETFWNAALQRGVIDGTAAAPVTPAPRWATVASAFADGNGVAARTIDGAPNTFELVFRQDSSVYDGRFANNPWLQELPDPMTSLTWGNAAIVSPATAERLHVNTGDLLRLRYRGRELSAPALVLPGTADGVVALHVGYGRGAGDEQLVAGVGVNAYRLWTADAPYAGADLAVERLEGQMPLAFTQTHWTLEGRPIALQATRDEYRRNPVFTREQQGRTLSLYDGPPLGGGDQWAMTIDLAACTGCSACVVACQAENNIPVVGKDGVLHSREMHWVRIDRYFTGDVADPGVIRQPMLCQHCEKAPCEYVCPVNATVHSPDGLNEMVYNRCVGTRFCSNNCPYKVRRFNWFDYNAEVAETERMAKNPHVTVRARGVMEKCTFCVQRIREAQIAAKVDERPLRDGDVRTACQQACPTQAIVFGSLNDPAAAVVQQRAEPRSYAVLHDLGTEPRVRYLARITNPNPALQGHGDGV